MALAKGFVDDMRSRYVELEDHTHALHSEAEDLCRQVQSAACAAHCLAALRLSAARVLCNEQQPLGSREGEFDPHTHA